MHTDDQEQSRGATTPTTPDTRIPTFGDGRHYGDGGRIGVPRATQAPTPAAASTPPEKE